MCTFLFLRSRLYSAHLCAAVTFESVSTRCAQSVQSKTHFWILRFPYFSDSCIFQSRVFHHCSLVPRFPVPRFPPLQSGAAFSSPAFSTPAFLLLPRFPVPRFQRPRLNIVPTVVVISFASDIRIKIWPVVGELKPMQLQVIGNPGLNIATIYCDEETRPTTLPIYHPVSKKMLWKCLALSTQYTSMADIRRRIELTQNIIAPSCIASCSKMPFESLNNFVSIDTLVQQ